MKNFNKLFMKISTIKKDSEDIQSVIKFRLSNESQNKSNQNKIKPLGNKNIYKLYIAY